MERRRVNAADGYCLDCGEGLYFSGCSAPTCDGWGCPDCGDGCDLDFTDEDGICATELREHKEGGHCDTSYRVTDKNFNGFGVVFCPCGSYLIFDDDGDSGHPRELTAKEWRSLQDPLPDVSAL